MLDKLQQKYIKQVYSSPTAELIKKSKPTTQDDTFRNACLNMLLLIKDKLMYLEYFSNGYYRDNTAPVYHYIPTFCYRKTTVSELGKTDGSVLKFLLNKLKEYKYETAWNEYILKEKDAFEVQKIIKYNINKIEKHLEKLSNKAKETKGLNASYSVPKEPTIKETLEFAENNLVGKSIYHQDIGKKIRFSKAGIKKAISGKRGVSRIRLQLVYLAKNILKSSRLISTEKDDKKRRQIKFIYKLNCFHSINGVEYRIFIILRESENGSIYYDHDAVKIKKHFQQTGERENTKSAPLSTPKMLMSNKDTKNKSKTKGLNAVETILYVDNEPKEVKTTSTTQQQQTLADVEKTAPKVNDKEIEKPKITQTKRVKTLKGLRSMNAEIEKAPLFNIQGVTGQFLQAVERKPKESVAVVLSTPQGTGKTTAVYKWMNDIAPMYSTLFLSLEEHPDSNLATDKRDKYLLPQAQANINTAGSIPNKETLLNWIEAHEVIVIDSWQKLVEIVGKINFDKDLRKAFDGKLFIIIFQQTTDGKAKGGSDKVFDGDIIIYGEKGDSFNENYLFFDKNRYTTVSLDEIRYNIANHEVYNPKELEEIETKEVVLEV